MEFTLDDLIKSGNWKELSRFKYVPEDILTQYADKLDWVEVSWNQKLSEHFIILHRDRINWYFASLKQIIPEYLLEEHMNELSPYGIFTSKTISNSFKEKYKLYIR